MLLFFGGLLSDSITLPSGFSRLWRRPRRIGERSARFGDRVPALLVGLSQAL